MNIRHVKMDYHGIKTTSFTLYIIPRSHRISTISFSVISWLLREEAAWSRVYR